MNKDLPSSPQADTDSKRLIRIETKLSKLLEHFGLTADGLPIKPAAPAAMTHSRKEKQQ